MMKNTLLISLLFLAFSFLMHNCKKTDEVAPQKTIKTESPDPLAWTQEEIALIMSHPADSPMRIIQVTNYEDSLILRKQCIDIVPNPEDSVLVRLIERLKTTVISNGRGVGLAAPQVGVNRNMYWLQRQDKSDYPWELYMNPLIVSWSQDSVTYIGDGCLSFPSGSNRNTRRAKAISVQHVDINGQQHVFAVTGFSHISNNTAIIFQHETDHLNGILFIDRAVN